jgi:DNA-directed RNA polymerase specialized sigma24 family protein
LLTATETSVYSAATPQYAGATPRATPHGEADEVTSQTLLSLNSEWVELVATSAAPVADWVQHCPELAQARDLDEILTSVPAAPDAVLGALLQLGAAGERLAWRVVLQAMLGKAVRLSCGREERLAEAVAELWVVIAEYPLQRRPRSIAANLAWALRRRLAGPPMVVGDPASGEPSGGPTGAQALATARRLGLIDARAHLTLWLVYIDGLSSTQAAAELGTTPDLVRYHCSRSLRRLAGRAELLAA